VFLNCVRKFSSHTGQVGGIIEVSPPYLKPQKNGPFAGAIFDVFATDMR